MASNEVSDVEHRVSQLEREMRELRAMVDSDRVKLKELEQLVRRST